MATQNGNGNGKWIQAIIIGAVLFVINAFWGLVYNGITNTQKESKEELATRINKIETNLQDLFILKSTSEVLNIRIDARLKYLEDYRDETVRLELESMRKENDDLKKVQNGK